EACSTFNVTYGGREYWCSPKYLNFDSAEHECAINGGHLAEIPDEETNVAIHLALEFLRIDPENRWIGVHDRIQEGEFVNMRNKKQKYLQWGNFGPPTGIFKPEADCVSSLLGTWWALNCSNLFQALCSKTLGCTCACRRDFGTDNQTWVQEMKIARIKTMLLVAKSTLSSRIRQKISADDPRMTSRVMGNVLGGGVLTVIVFLVLSNDILKLYRHITEHECN
ncbi:uncharacterized protein LOC134236156, partial [Saccostrea cucullata]|uniref:uncharacterized protein LOC134236156 n=1 Tax=Saccostrea cuccullata TaxID=36930 RepID=UPI002ED4468E